MKKIYNNVGNLVLKVENSKLKCKIEINDAQLIKEFVLNESNYLYVQIATYNDYIMNFINKYKNIDIELQTPAICIDKDNFGKEFIDSKSFKSMNVDYKDTLYCYKKPSSLTMIFSNDKNISLSNIKFILNDIKEINKEINKKEPTIKLDWRIGKCVEGIENDLVNISDEIKDRSEIKTNKNYNAYIDKGENNIDFKNEILENEDISIIGQAEFIKQLFFDVCNEREFIVTTNVDFTDKILCLTRLDDCLVIEKIKDENGDYIWHDTEMLWLDDDILQDAMSKKQEDRFLTDKDLIWLY